MLITTKKYYAWTGTLSFFLVYNSKSALSSIVHLSQWLQNSPKERKHFLLYYFQIDAGNFKNVVTRVSISSTTATHKVTIFRVEKGGRGLSLVKFASGTFKYICQLEEKQWCKSKKMLMAIWVDFYAEFKKKVADVGGLLSKVWSLYVDQTSLVCVYFKKTKKIMLRNFVSGI